MGTQESIRPVSDRARHATRVTHRTPRRPDLPETLATLNKMTTPVLSPYAGASRRRNASCSPRPVGALTEPPTTNPRRTGALGRQLRPPFDHYSGVQNRVKA